jgi:hypothetical protein
MSYQSPVISSLGGALRISCISGAPGYFSAVFGKPVTGLFLLFPAVCPHGISIKKSTGQAVRTALFSLK